MAAEVIMIIALLMLIWTYLLYPAFVMTLAAFKRSRRKENTEQEHNTDIEQPFISVIMSVHNEEKVIREKTASLVASGYPASLTEFIIGSDGSTDGTERIMKDIALADTRIRFVHYGRRRGKAATLNDLVSEARGDILVITDANVIFTPCTLRHLAEGFRLPALGLCDATVIPASTTAETIATGECRKLHATSPSQAACRREAIDGRAASPIAKRLA